MLTCFYHNDLDGRCAGALVSYFTRMYDEEKQFIEVDYNKVMPYEVKSGKVYFVDYSFTPDTKPYLDSLLDNPEVDIVWIDHHTSSIQLQEDYPYLKAIKGIRNEAMSGAMLTYHYFDPHGIVPRFIRLVDDYDCWKFQMSPVTEYFKLGMESGPDDALDEVWKHLLNEHRVCSYNTFDAVVKTGEVVKNYIDSTNTYYREHFAYESMIDGIKCMVVNWKTNSWVFGDLVNKYPITMVWAFDGNYYSYSIFSLDPNIDCSVIAQKLGGGGHKGAAGFKSKELLFREVKI